MNTLRLLTAGLAVAFTLTGCITDPDDGGGGEDDGGGVTLDGDTPVLDGGTPGDARVRPDRGPDARPLRDLSVIPDAARDGSVGPLRDAEPIPPDQGIISGRVPAKHRPVAEMCDDERNSSGPFIDDWALEQGGDFVSCTAHEDCTEGDNGRCIGNGHDGWYCSYDRCFVDDDCDNVCECEGGFRGDFNVCVGGDCRTDADCGPGGYCSPSFGDCGEYTGVVAYYCHTPDDECIDDSDCDGDGNFGAPYCAYNPAAGKWMCSDSHCAG
jgi:hypothetical protein